MAENIKKQRATREKLKKSLIRLSMENGYHVITVGEICDDAGVYRSTFYRYYKNKEELLTDIENSYIEDTRNITREISDFHRLNPTDNYSEYRKTLEKDLEYHDSHRDMSLFLLSSMGDLRFSRKMEASIGKSYKARLRENLRDNPPLRDENYLVSFFAAGFVSTICRWLKDHDITSAETADFLIRMITVFSDFDDQDF